MNDQWLSAEECNDVVPDHHFGTTIENLEVLYSASADLACWHLEAVPTLEIDPSQLIDDLNDADGHAKAQSIRVSFRDGTFVPPVIIVHEPTRGMHPYMLIEGRHRYNAAHREGIDTVSAWVAHIGCCGGPEADL